MLTIVLGRDVVVKAYGGEHRGTVTATSARLGYLVQFENKTQQWIPAKYVAEISTGKGAKDGTAIV